MASRAAITPLRFVRTAADTVAPTLSLPDFIRGPGQDVRVPNNSTGGVLLPLTLANANGARVVTFALNYDPELLRIDAIEALPGGPPRSRSPPCGDPGHCR